MQLCAFVFLEDISDELPRYEETYLSVPMGEDMREAYRKLEDDIRTALKKHRGNRSVLSTMLNTLLLYPDHPYGLGTLYGTEFDSEAKCKVRFVIAETRDLPQDHIYSKERRLIEEIKIELAEGRRCQVFAVYTHKHDVTARLQRILGNEGIRTAVLRASVDTSKREAWYARQIKNGIQVVISHPKLVETGLDLLDFPTIIFYESGYSLHTLRQASRRSWRIGQRRPVRVKFLCYEGTMQTACRRFMGKKLLVALTMEGKFAGEGLQNIDEDDDMLSAMARELVERNRIGETADAVWKALNTEHQKLFPTIARSSDEAPPAETPDVLTETRFDPAYLVQAAINSQSSPLGDPLEHCLDGGGATESPPQSSRRCSASTSRTSICAARFGLLVHNFQFPNFQFTLRRNPMTTGTLVAGPLPKIGRAELAQIPVPEATSTHKPVPHHVIVESLVETLSFRHMA